MKDYRRLTVIVPVYNERNTVAEAIRRVRAVDLPVDKEILIVDDGSTDGTSEIIERLRDSTVRVIRLERNLGKGAAVRAAIESCTGDAVIVHDADLEYDPRDWPALLRPMMEGDALAVYGSRFTGERRNMMFWHWIGNRFLSLVTNILYNTTLSDMETCYKLLDGDLVRSLRLTSTGFEIEPEITAKVLRLGHRIWEVPIRYAGRELDQGKKIAWTDGFPALWTLVSNRFAPRHMLLR